MNRSATIPALLFARNGPAAGKTRARPNPTGTPNQRVVCGGALLSHTLPGAVPSPCQALASGFGKGPGVTPGPWPPQDRKQRNGNRSGIYDRGGLGTG